MCKNRCIKLGHHGTDFDSGQSILKSKFKPSRGNYHWLGDGVYFFENNIQMAIEWCKAESQSRSRRYNRYVILKSCIAFKLAEILDLTSEEGSALFHGHRDILIDRIKGAEYGVKVDDGKVINQLCKFFPYKVIYSKFYIKILRDRVLNLNSRITNCSVLCIRDVDNCISDTLICREGDTSDGC